MAQRPLALGLQVCEKVVVEAETRNLTFVNCFVHRDVKSIPSEPLSFLVCSTLTDGHGRMPLRVRIETLDDFDSIAERTGVITFRHPLQKIRLRVPMEEVSFPTAGGYQVLIFVDNEMVASQTIQIVLAESSGGQIVDNTSPDSGQPRKKRVAFDDELVVDLVLDDSNSSNAITPLTPEQQRISERLRDRYWAAVAEYEEMKRQARADAATPQNPSADSSASGPTSGS